MIIGLSPMVQHYQVHLPRLIVSYPCAVAGMRVVILVLTLVAVSGAGAEALPAVAHMYGDVITSSVCLPYLCSLRKMLLLSIFS